MTTSWRVAGTLGGGLLVGIAWYATLFPVSTCGAVIYDLSRYLVAVAVPAVLFGLIFEWMQRFGFLLLAGGGVCGLVMAAVASPTELGRLQQTQILLLGVPLVLAVCAAAGVLFSWTIARAVGRPALATHSPVAAPRTFGIRMLMVVITLAATFFAISQWLELPPTIPLGIATFVAIVCGLQMWLQRVPRVASVGAGCLLLTSCILVLAFRASARPPLSMLLAAHSDQAFFAAHVAAVGAFAGYIAGVLVSGLVLLSQRGSHSRRI